MVISIDYDQSDPQSYRAVELWIKQELILRMGKDFGQDFEVVCLVARQLHRFMGEPIYFSSTVHDFLREREQVLMIPPDELT